MYIESYNQNLYINCLNQLFQGLNEIEHFLDKIEISDDFKSIDNMVTIYDSIFINELISKHIKYKVEMIYKPYYLSDPGPHTKSNSFWHINLTIYSDEILWLDDLYNLQISRLTKFYKHLFSKIDNYFISFNTEQLIKYQAILSEIKNDIAKFLKYSEHREIIDKRDKLSEQNLNNIPFGGLFYIAHLNNIQSILELGILSHNLAHKNGFVNVDISNKEVNARRNRIEPSLGGNIHDFAPLFIHPKNPTFYYWCLHESKDNLILIKVNPHILLTDNVAFSDGNAAVRTTHFYNNIADFNKLNWTVIKDNYWTNYPDGKRIKCSEVLVQEKVPLYYVTDIFVYSTTTLEKILPLFPNHLGIKTNVNKQLYF